MERFFKTELITSFLKFSFPLFLILLNGFPIHLAPHLETWGLSYSPFPRKATHPESSSGLFPLYATTITSHVQPPILPPAYAPCWRDLVSSTCHAARGMGCTPDCVTLLLQNLWWVLIAGLQVPSLIYLLNDHISPFPHP